MCFTWFVDKILQIRDSMVKIKVLVHEAFFLNDPKKEPYFFIKVINLSYNTPATITHVWIEDGATRLDILNSERPLPRKLEKTDIWETWIKKELVKDCDNIFDNVRVLLSSDKKYKSRKNLKVPPTGFVANN